MISPNIEIIKISLSIILKCWKNNEIMIIFHNLWCGILHTFRKAYSCVQIIIVLSTVAWLGYCTLKSWFLHWMNEKISHRLRRTNIEIYHCVWTNVMLCKNPGKFGKWRHKFVFISKSVRVRSEYMVAHHPLTDHS